MTWLRIYTAVQECLPWTGQMAISESQNLDARMFGPVQIRTEKAITFVKKKGQAALKRRGRKWKKSRVSQRAFELLGSVSERWWPLVECPRPFSVAARAVRKIRCTSNALLMFYFDGRTKEHIRKPEGKHIPQEIWPRVWLPVGGPQGTRDAGSSHTKLANKR